VNVDGVANGFHPTLRKEREGWGTPGVDGRAGKMLGFFGFASE
jgi:hypothetical protein